MVSRQDAFDATLEYFNGDDLATDAFLTKYALKSPDGELLESTPTDMHRRLAREFARIEAKYPNPLSEDEIFELLDGFKWFVPQGSPMSGIGNPHRLQSLSNCFVIPPPSDSYGGILLADQRQVQIMKRRGGVGFDISAIRPKGVATNNAAVTTDGIGVFMERFSNSCREVAQGGRRGALMLTISVHHPQIRDFIQIKRDLKKVTGANISIRLSDEFMRAVKQKKTVQLRWPVESKDPSIKFEVDAPELWHEIIESAHACAEPGLLFWDTIVENSPADIYSSMGFKTTSTNPCAEIAMGDDACRLGVINVKSFVKDPFKPTASFDWKRFVSVVIASQRLMDDLVDLELEQIDKIIEKIEFDPEEDFTKGVELQMWRLFREQGVKGRRTGLGPTAIGDTIAALGMRYGSPESVEFIDRLYKTLAVSSYRSSAIMASERGTFPIYDAELEDGHVFLERVKDADPELRDLISRNGRRNIACNTTAPCGTVSCETQTTSGIEPVYLISYTRRKKKTTDEGPVDFVDDMGDKWEEFQVFHHGFREWMEANDKTFDDVESSPYWKATAMDVDWVAKVKLQAAAQQWVDHAISNTTNVPEDVSVDVVKDIYMTGWESGCKGVTVYREGSRSGVLVSKTSHFKQHHAPRRPLELECDIHQVNIKGEAWTVLVGLYEGKPYEIIGGKSKYVDIPKRYEKGVVVKHPRKTMNSIYDLKIENGDVITIKDLANAFDNPTQSALTRVISLALRHGTPIQYVVEQLQKEKGSDMFSFAKSIARVLKGYILDGTATGIVKSCESCGSTEFAYQEGCVSCKSCGWARCG